MKSSENAQTSARVRTPNQLAQYPDGTWPDQRRKDSKTAPSMRTSRVVGISFFLRGQRRKGSLSVLHGSLYIIRQRRVTALRVAGHSLRLRTASRLALRWQG